MDWQELYGNWILVPDRPTAIVHFLGGAFVATAPQLTYRRILEYLAAQGYAVVATPFINTFDHREIAESVYKTSDRALEALQSRIIQRYVPIYGMGHSMGCKLHLLIGSYFPVERAGNILISFNNYAAKEAVPLVEQLTQFLSPQVFAVEFTPSPAETNQIVRDRYKVRRNLIIKFSNDTLDQSLPLAEILELRFPGMTTTKRQGGNHLTPLGPDFKWQAGQSFSAFDAIGQWMRQELYRELHQLEKIILLWLDPLAR
jgi:hypothetical protein